MTQHPIPPRSDSAPDDDLDPGVLERHWVGEASSEEAAAVAAWARAHPARWSRYEQMARGLAASDWTPLSTDETTRRTDAILRTTERSASHTSASHASASHASATRTMDMAHRVAPSRQSQHATSLWHRRIVGVVAGIGAAILVGILVRGGTSRDTARGVVTAHRTYATATAQHATFSLPDGTRVTLAPQSVLEVDPIFGGATRTRTRTRTVTLRGEAYFDVRAQSEIPFIVRTGSATTRVLGTTFVVRRYETETATQVAVVSGKVAVTPSRVPTPLTMTAGMVALVSDSLVTRMTSDSASQYAAWTSGALVFRDTPMPRVLDELARWYGYRFQVADSALTERRITAVLSTQSSAHALETLKLLLNAELTFDGDVVTLHARRAHGATSRERPRSPFTTSQREIGR